eukprot:TCONS_00033760-protein
MEAQIDYHQDQQNSISKLGDEDIDYDFELDGQKVDEYYCLICFLLLRDIAQMPCKHMLCKHCLDDWGKYNANLSCPKCKRRFNRKEVTSNEPLDQIIKHSLKVKCKSGKECRWTGTISEYSENHYRKCDFVELKCAFQGCHIKLKRVEILSHEINCVHRDDCSYCKQLLNDSNLKDHYDVCPKYPVDCPNSCCTVLQQCQVEQHIKDDCINRIVPCGFVRLGCNFEMKNADLSTHFDANIHHHMKLMFMEMDRMRNTFQAESKANSVKVQETEDKLQEATLKIKTLEDNEVTLKKSFESVKTELAKTKERLLAAEVVQKLKHSEEKVISDIENPGSAPASPEKKVAEEIQPEPFDEADDLDLPEGQSQNQIAVGEESHQVKKKAGLLKSEDPMKNQASSNEVEIVKIQSNPKIFIDEGESSQMKEKAQELLKNDSNDSMDKLDKMITSLSLDQKSKQEKDGTESDSDGQQSKDTQGAPSFVWSEFEEIIPENLEQYELRRTSNPWKRCRITDAQLSKDVLEMKDLERNVRAIVNKLTPQKFKELVNQVINLRVDTVRKLEMVVDIIYETAINIPLYSVAYANMCRVFTDAFKHIPGDKSNLHFRKILLNKCQKEFEKEFEDDIQMEQVKSKPFETEKQPKKCKWKEELDNEEFKNRRRILGCVLFIGELFKLKIISEKIMHECILKFIRVSRPALVDQDLECICKLFSTVGIQLDHEEAKPRMDQYFQQIEKIIEKKKISSRIKFALKDVIDLRANHWVPRRDEGNPKTIDQIAREAQQKAKEEEMYRQQEKLKPREPRGRVGGRDSPSVRNPTSADGWTNVPSKATRGFGPTVDASKFKIQKKNDSSDISLGPGGRPGAWSKGASGGSSSRSGSGSNTPTNEIEQKGNRFDLLSGSSDTPAPLDNRRGGSRPNSGMRKTSQGTGRRAQQIQQYDQQNIPQQQWLEQTRQRIVQSLHHQTPKPTPKKRASIRIVDPYSGRDLTSQF